MIRSRDKWVPVTIECSITRLRMEERPPDMKCGCEYSELPTERRKGVVLQFGDWGWC